MPTRVLTQVLPPDACLYQEVFRVGLERRDSRVLDARIVARRRRPGWLRYDVSEWVIDVVRTRRGTYLFPRLLSSGSGWTWWGAERALQRHRLALA